MNKTVKSLNETLKSLAPEDIYDIDSKNVGKLQEVYNECLQEKQEIERYIEYETIYKKWQQVGEDKLDALELLILDEKDFVHYNKLIDKPKFKRPRVVFMVFDDLLNNPLVFGYKRSNFINQTIILHRHDSPDRVPINMLLISQSFKSVPTLVRKQIDYFVMLKNANKIKLLQNIQDEVGGVVGMNDLVKLYDYAMGVEYGALIVSIHPADKIRFRLSWDKELTIGDTPCDCESKGKPFGSCGKLK